MKLEIGQIMKFKMSKIHTGHYSINKLAHNISLLTDCPRKFAFKEAKNWLYAEQKNNKTNDVID